MIAFRSLLIPLTAAVMNLLAAGRRVRRRHRRLPGGLPRRAARGRDRADRGVPAGDDARDPVRALDGLPGVPRQPHARGVGAHRTTTRTRCGSARPRPGRVITAAATIMILVFGSFLLAGQRVIAEFGIGLASAVFLDAFILRTVLVPAHDAPDRQPQLVAAARTRPRAAARRRGGRRDLSARPRRAPLASARRATALQREEAEDLLWRSSSPGHVAGVDPAHPALGADPPLASAAGRGGEGGVDVLDLPVGRARRLIGRVVGDEREVQLGVRAGLSPPRARNRRRRRGPGAR